jgi:hypothetical protein
MAGDTNGAIAYTGARLASPHPARSCHATSSTLLVPSELPIIVTHRA